MNGAESGFSGPVIMWLMLLRFIVWEAARAIFRSILRKGSSLGIDLLSWDSAEGGPAHETGQERNKYVSVVVSVQVGNRSKLFHAISGKEKCKKDASEMPDRYY